MIIAKGKKSWLGVWNWKQRLGGVGGGFGFRIAAESWRKPCAFWFWFHRY